MGKFVPRTEKIRSIAKNGLLFSAGTIFLGADAAVKVSKKAGEIAAVVGKNIVNGSRIIANNAIERGKIDNRVLELITIKPISDDIEGWINSEYERQLSEINRQSLKNYYEQWLRYLNEYVLFHVFGHLIVLDQAKGIIESTPSYSEDERKLNVVALLFVEAQALRKWIESIIASLPTHLNQEDDDWLSNIIFPITSKPKQSSFLLGRSLAHINHRCTALLRNMSNIERSASVIENAIKMQFKGTQEVIANIVKDPKNLNPWILLNNAENVVAKIAPGLFTGRMKKQALDEFVNCVESYDHLFSTIVPPLVVETQRDNLSNIKSIIDRDFSYIGKQNHDNTEIKKALFKRILKLEAFKKFTKIGMKETLLMSYSEVINNINSLSADFRSKMNGPL